MKVRVVYDSVFGNTEQVAQAVGTALSSQGDVETVRVGDMQPEELTGLDLLIVGSPTRAFRPTGATTKLLRAIPERGLAGVRVAAFDTRISPADVDSRFLNIMAKLFGYAAEPIAKRLQSKSGELAVAPEGFLVEDTEGPLKEGELERAAAWAERMTVTP
jgi:flavodoxin I